MRIEERKGIEARWKGGKTMRKLLSFVTAAVLGVPPPGVPRPAAGPAPAGGASPRAALAIAAGLAIAIGAFGAALGQGRMAAAAMESIGRNPNRPEEHTSEL